MNLKAIPKVELHAHLSGSISPETINKIDPSLVLDRAKPTLKTFFKLFATIHKVTETRENLIKATSNVIDDFNADNVVYLELRTTPRDTKFMTKRQYVDAVNTAIKSQKSTTITRLILCIDRKHDLETAMQIVNIAIETMADYTVGVDLCGDPSIGEYESLHPAFLYAKSRGLKITMHIAEIPDFQLRDNVGLMLDICDRIGHGTFLDESHGYSHLPFEVCITSNIITGTVQRVEDHHFASRRRIKHPVIVCTDDSSVFQTSLTSEMELVKDAFGLTPIDIWTLGNEAVEFAFADDGIKERLKKVFLEFRDHHFS